MTSKAPEASEADVRTKRLKSISERAAMLAKEVDEMTDGPLRRRLKNALTAVQAVVDQFSADSR